MVLSMGISGGKETGPSVRSLVERDFGRGFHILECDESVEVSSRGGTPIFQMYFTADFLELYDSHYREAALGFANSYGNAFLGRRLIVLEKSNPEEDSLI